MTDLDDWGGILDKDEALLWQDRPDPAFFLHKSTLCDVPIGSGMIASCAIKFLVHLRQDTAANGITKNPSVLNASPMQNMATA